MYRQMTLDDWLYVWQRHCGPKGLDLPCTFLCFRFGSTSLVRMLSYSSDLPHVAALINNGYFKIYYHCYNKHLQEPYSIIRPAPGSKGFVSLTVQ